MDISQQHKMTLFFLSSLYLCQPTRTTIELWRTLPEESAPQQLEPLFQALAAIDPSSQEEMDALQWEFTRLFIGPYKLPAPPWESVYTSPARLLMQDAYDDVLDCYRAAGFQVEEANIMPDHLGIELNFLATLFQRMEEFPDQRETCRKRLMDFYVRHIRNWVPHFLQDLAAAADHPLYLNLARTTAVVLLDIFPEGENATR